MKNIYSNIFKVNNNNLIKAINHLKKKQLIGVPTETVYGLAGNAYSSQAVKKIYALKIFITTMEFVKANKIFVPKSGLVDGMINEIFYKNNASKLDS